MATKAQLVKASKELNILFFEEPQIDETGTPAVMTEGIVDSIRLYEDGDELSDPTRKVLADLEWEKLVDTLDNEEVEKDSKKTAKEGTIAVLQSLGIWINEDEEKPAKATKATKAKAEPKPKAEKKPKEPKVKKVTKKAIVLEMTARKKGATIEEIAERIEKEGIDDDHDKNLLVVKLWLSKLGWDTKKKAIEANPRFSEANKK